MFLLGRRGHLGPQVRHTRRGSVAVIFISLVFFLFSSFFFFSLLHTLSFYPWRSCDAFLTRRASIPVMYMPAKIAYITIFSKFIHRVSSIAIVLKFNI